MKERVIEIKSIEQGHIILGNEEINYIIERKKVKNINFRFSKDKDLIISSPKNITLKYLLESAERNAKPILRIYHSLEDKKHYSLENKEYKSGEEIYFWGENVKLCFDDKVESSCLRSSNLYIKEDEKAPQIKKKRALEQFLDNEVKAFMTDASNKLFNEYFKELDEQPEIIFKALKSRWGSCCKAKNLITYNKNLVFLPKEFALYVAVHEFCHLRVFDHSKAFYAEVEKIMPDYKRIRNIQKEYAR